MSSKKGQYHTKKVSFHGKEMTLYSLDGVTWSTRPDELEVIIQRHSTEQAAFTSDLKGEEREKVEKVKPKPRKFVRVHNDDDLDEIIEEDSIEDLEPDLAGDDEIAGIEEIPLPKMGKEIPMPGKIAEKTKDSKRTGSQKQSISVKTPQKTKAPTKGAKAASIKGASKKSSKPVKGPKGKSVASKTKKSGAKGKK